MNRPRRSHYGFSRDSIYKYSNDMDKYFDYLESQITELKSEITVLKNSKI